MTDDKKKPEEAREEEYQGPETGPKPEHEEKKEPNPGKGAGRKGNVQKAPKDQRGRPDPKRKDRPRH